VHDEGGNPVAGARVSIDGIEAPAVTGSDGSFRVSDRSLSTPSAPAMAGTAAATSGPEISVLAVGFDPFIATLNVMEGELAQVDLVRSGLEPVLTLASPEDGKTFLVAGSCSDPLVTVEGFAALGVREGFRLDVVVVLDRSGSTRDLAFDADGDGNVDTVLDVEVAAARCLIAGLDPLTSRVALVEFNDAAAMLGGFTNDMDAADAAVMGIGDSSGGTNFEAAFLAARQAFLDAEENDPPAEPSEDPDPGIPAPYRAVVFLTDGIATSHGVPRDMTDSNLTQSSADRKSAIDAARSLGEDTGAQLFGFSILPPDDPNRTRTTLPHCVAACGGGRFETVENIAFLEETLCGEPLLSVLSVSISNLTAGGPALSAVLGADGSFSEEVPVAMTGSPAADGTIENAIQVTLTAFSGPMAKSVSRMVIVRFMDEAVYDALTENEIYTAQAAAGPVSSLGIAKPTGGNVSIGMLQTFLGSENEDAVQLFGIEMLTALDGAGGTGPVTVTVDFAYKAGCYANDIGYLVLDPEHMPKNAKNAMSGVTSSQVLFHSGSLGSSSCNGQSIAAGTASRQFTVAGGSSIAFFVIPNGTLADYKSQPNKVNPLFSVRSLNPGSFAQALSFRSLNGRTKPGPSQGLETPGPLMVVAFEDIEIASRNSDSDFDDLAFTVRMSSGHARPDAAGCEE
jgi:hypothetical protein